MIVIFDVQTYSRALVTATKLSNGRPVFELSVEDYADSLREKGCVVSCRHLTSSIDCCSGILTYGLRGWSSVLALDSGLGKVFSALGIEYDSEGGLARYGRPFGVCCQQDPSKALLMDDCVNAYLYCGGTSEGYSDSPEILRTLRDRAFPEDANVRRAEALWREKATAYCVSFGVQVSEIDVITDYYPVEEKTDIYYALACVLADVLNAGSVRRLQMLYGPIVLKRGVVIPPQFLQVSEICNLDWDWDCKR